MEIPFLLQPDLVLRGDCPEATRPFGADLRVSPRGTAKRFGADTCFSAMSVSYFWIQFPISVSALPFL